MTASLPAFTDYEPFRIWRADPAQWLPIALDIVRSHGLTCAAPHVFSTGTNVVMALDEKLILKIFPPFLRSQFVSERGSLAQLRGQASDRDPRNRRRRRARRMAVSRHHAAAGHPGRASVAVSAGRGKGARPRGNRRDHCRGAARPDRRVGPDRAGLGHFHAWANRGMSRPARAPRIAGEILATDWTNCCAMRPRSFRSTSRR